MIPEDIDNLEKAVYDALNQIVYVDDRQICEVHARKIIVARGEEPRVEVTIEPGGTL
jgi:Holliday junction resolvase RusA-like endonuclease